ncbi:MAG: serine hydroxymethyltransferase [SAR116 cluster bacterium MED-G05]|nr:serine hydroxymethyltransferase [Rhodospirillaceae bacterium]PDH64005.1 MAG: serine hydroxymethyltransferase [SAR116 cluster bacterium MED-G05]HAO56713.1 serine hydroxymethyltransferase [Alphaproteobacteria bacterium]
MNGFFSASLAESDPALASAIGDELVRQQDQIEMIASENIVSTAVMEAQGSVLTNKYAEGYSGRRYYGGCEHIDVVETLAIERAKELFGAAFVNVQPHSGAQANQAVFLSMLKPGDTILGMSLAAGGHLTHGAAPNLSGKWFNAEQYGVDEDTAQIDFDALLEQAKACKPKMILAGGSAYPRTLDFAAFRKVADEVGAYLMVDMAHISGLVAAGLHPNPVPHAHIVTSTTHKTLRAGRGGIILTNDEALGKKINSAVFPGLQGGPLMHAIAGKAAGFGEALRPEFRRYTEQVIRNAQVLSEGLISRGLDIVSGGTDTHLVLVDLRPKGLTGNISEVSLENAGITCNKNGVPFDPQPPMVTSGVRLGAPAGTTRGFGETEFTQIAEFIGDVLDGLAKNSEDNQIVEKKVREDVRELCRAFPIY